MTVANRSLTRYGEQETIWFQVPLTRVMVDVTSLVLWARSMIMGQQPPTALPPTTKTYRSFQKSTPPAPYVASMTLIEEMIIIPEAAEERARVLQAEEDRRVEAERERAERRRLSEMLALKRAAEEQELRAERRRAKEVAQWATDELDVRRAYPKRDLDKKHQHSFMEHKTSQERLESIRGMHVCSSCYTPISRGEVGVCFDCGLATQAKDDHWPTMNANRKRKIR